MRILIIDDHQLFSEGLMLLLEELSEGTTLVAFKDCEEAIDNSTNHKTDLIILDYYLVGSNGEESISKLKEKFPSTSIVIISSEESSDIIRSAITNGAAGFIPKSSTRHVLISALKLVLAGGIYLPHQALLNTPPVEARKKGEFSARQIEVLGLAVKGVPNKLIADQLSIAEGTVKAHLYSIFQILGVKNRTEAVYAAAKINTISDLI